MVEFKAHKSMVKMSMFIVARMVVQSMGYKLMVKV